MLGSVPGSSTPRVQLRSVVVVDLPIFHEQMHDPEACRTAAHTPRDGEAFFAHWHRIMADPANWLNAVIADGEVAGHVAGWVVQDQRLIGYWIDRRWWGRGVASAALRQFLEMHDERPLFAHVARHNGGSIRVLEKCGFVVDEVATAALDKPADGVAEFVYRLT
jgi:RimJ/RimL family protein N-acetyltransferase